MIFGIGREGLPAHEVRYANELPLEAKKQLAIAGLNAGLAEVGLGSSRVYSWRRRIKVWRTLEEYKEKFSHLNSSAHFDGRTTHIALGKTEYNYARGQDVFTSYSLETFVRQLTHEEAHREAGKRTQKLISLDREQGIMAFTGGYNIQISKGSNKLGSFFNWLNEAAVEDLTLLGFSASCRDARIKTIFGTSQVAEENQNYKEERKTIQVICEHIASQLQMSPEKVRNEYIRGAFDRSSQFISWVEKIYGEEGLVMLSLWGNHRKADSSGIDKDIIKYFADPDIDRKSQYNHFIERFVNDKNYLQLAQNAVNAIKYLYNSSGTGASTIEQTA